MDTNDTRRAARDPVVSRDEEHDEPLDSQLAEVLAAYDELLAIGVGGATSEAPTTAKDAELQDAKACLQILEHVFPRNLPLPSGEGRGEGEMPHSKGPLPFPLPEGEGIRSLGPFEILSELGRGGGGIVFLAVESELGRKVALKVPYPEVLVRRDLRQRFVQEAQAAAKLEHPNIVPVYSAGEVGPICYIASAYCEGPTLAAWLKARTSPVPFATAAQLVAVLADAIEHAHCRGILHRDIKPSNVLLEEQRADATPSSPLLAPCPAPKLTDFGLAKLLEVERDATRTGAVLGTPTYMSPEQAEGRLADIGVGTDVYGLGVVLYELISGRPPFQGNSDLETLHAIAHDDAPPLRQFRRHVPRDLEAICLKCLEKHPPNRYQQAVDLAADLRRFLDGRPTIARPVGWSGRAARWARRRPRAAAVTATVLLATVAAIFGFRWHLNRLELLEASANRRIQSQADEEYERTRQYDYASHIQAAYQAWQSTDLKAASQLLDRCRPRSSEKDLRGFEWYYVRQLCAGGLTTLRGHDGPVLGAVFAPDGERLASCGADGTLRIWDTDDGTLKATILAHEGPANAIAWSGDGLLLATVGDDSLVRIWNAKTRQLRAGLEGASGKLLSVAFSPDSRHVAAAGQESKIRIWNAATGDPFRTIHGHTDTIYSIAFAPGGDRIASGSADSTARIWDIRKSGESVVVLKPNAPVVALAFSPNGRTLATVDSQITLWDLPRQSPTVRVNSHQGDVFSIAFSPDGRTLASASNDRTVQINDVSNAVNTDSNNDRLKDGKLLQTYRGHTNMVAHVTFSPQGTRLATVGRDGTIQIWDAERPQDRKPFMVESYHPRTFGLVASSARNMLAIASQSDEQSELLIRKSFGEDAAISVPVNGLLTLRSMTFSSDGKSFAFAVNGGRIFNLDCIHGGTRTLVGEDSLYADCAFSPDGTLFAAASYDWNSVRVFDVATGDLLASIPGQRALAFSPDGRLLATESTDKHEVYPVELWDVSAGRSVGRLFGHTGQIDSIVFSANGDLLATGSADRTARLWNVDDCTERFVLREHGAGVNHIVFLLGEKSLATSGADGKVMIWHLATGRHLLTLNVNVGAVTGMAVSADGRTLATASNDADGTPQVDLWTAPPEEAELSKQYP